MADQPLRQDTRPRGQLSRERARRERPLLRDTRVDVRHSTSTGVGARLSCPLSLSCSAKVVLSRASLLTLPAARTRSGRAAMRPCATANLAAQAAKAMSKALRMPCDDLRAKHATCVPFSDEACSYTMHDFLVEDWLTALSLVLYICPIKCENLRNRASSSRQRTVARAKALVASARCQAAHAFPTARGRR